MGPEQKRSFAKMRLHRALHLIGTQASCTYVNVTGSPIHERLYTDDIGLKAPVAASV